MKNMIALISLFALFAANGFTSTLDGGLYGVTGSNNYKGLNAFLEVGGDMFSIRPMVTTAKSDGLENTLVDYSLRVGYNRELYSLGVTGGFMPNTTTVTDPVGGELKYGRMYGSVDATIFLIGDRMTGVDSKDTQGGLLGLNAGGSLSYIKHKFDGSDPDSVGQTNFSVFGAASIAGITGTLRYTKALSYSEEIENITEAPAFNYDSALLFAVPGFLDSVMSARLDVGMIPFIKPYVSYSRTEIKAIGEKTHFEAYGVGASANVLMVTVSAGYQYIKNSDSSDSDYFGVTAGLRF